jgi:hypothetical protein
VESEAPRIFALWSKWSIKNLPNRLELSLRSVLAQPNASVSGELAWIRFSRSSVAFETKRRYWRTKRADSVLPAPDSPEMTTACERFAEIIERCAAAATAKTCGGILSSASADW